MTQGRQIHYRIGRKITGAIKKEETLNILLLEQIQLGLPLFIHFHFQLEPYFRLFLCEVGWMVWVGMYCIMRDELGTNMKNLTISNSLLLET